MTIASPAAARVIGTDFRIGAVVRRAWSVYRRNVVRFTLIALFGFLPLLNLSYWSRITIGQVSVSGLPFLLMTVFFVLGQAMVLHAAVQDMRQRPVRMSEGIKVALARFFPLVGLAVIISIVAGALLSAYVFLVVKGFGPGVLSVGQGFAIVGSFLLFLVIIAVLVLSWLTSTPICVVERMGPFRSLRRSAELARGYRLQLLALFLLVAVGILLAIFGARLALRLAFAMMPASAFAFALGFPGNAVLQTLGLVWNGICCAFLWVLIAVIYHDLRVAKEGIDMDHVAAVFE